MFDSSTTWLSVLLVIVSINYLLFPFFENWPVWIRYLQCFVLGVALVLFLYLALYLLPMYVFSAVAAFALGISLHTFVPLLFVIFTIKLLRRLAKTSHKYLLPFFSGIGAALTIIFVFVIVWQSQIKQMNQEYRQWEAHSSNELKPYWVRVASSLPTNMLTERVLKSDLVYRMPDGENLALWHTPSRNFDEAVIHDPLVVVANWFSETILMPQEDRIKVLEVMYKARHQAIERLWSGSHLQTTKVQTQVQVWPQQRIAYTHLHVTVANTSRSHSWGREQQEAIYSFQLPEGGVVTALSLWIEGKESKGVLTTRAKADSAYKQIVGVEQRDPSVVHWREGNKVTVRVFPVIAGESREFSIGVTAPLSSKGSELVYQSVSFDGPPCSGTDEEVVVHFEQKPAMCQMPGRFTHHKDASWWAKGSYHPEWSFRFQQPALAQTALTFDGKSYVLNEALQKAEALTLNTVYLDVNKAWTADEFAKIYEAVKFKKVYVADEEGALVQLTEDNKEQWYRQLSAHRFSCFPFYEVTDAATSLVVTKGTNISPTLKDMAACDFMQRLQQYFANGTRIKLYNIGEEQSPYLQSLKQFGAFHYQQGTVLALRDLLLSRQFPVYEVADSSVVMDNAGITITQTDSAAASASGNAPDHLMRLYAYQHIMQQSGSALLQNKAVPNAVIQEAAQANVVSPASSLVVLESQKDYDQFDIAKSKNSLDNAAIHGKGAVPEPGVWVLIAVVLLLLGFTKYRFYKKAIHL
ncbi:hypothetical protein FLA_3822 [Filimonas lacunae]|nr:hypothetical protein FLA_3822 [Filimonas lacunae]